MNITEETIDSFLRGDLSETEITAFNKAVAADPKLQQEVSIQQDIIDAVKQHRHQQLKDRLNSVDVKPVGIGFFSSPFYKLAASIGVVALIVGSFSLFTNNTTKELSAVVESSTTAIEPAAKTTESAAPLVPAENTNSETENTLAVAEPAENKVTVETSKVASAPKTANSAIAQNKTPEASYEDLSEEPVDSDNPIEGINDNFNMPNMNHDGNTSTVSSPQIKVSIVKENNLGYRFFNNQLFLHGNFSNSTYELFELNNKPSKQLFLYFENNYYELIQGKTKVTSLTPITDKAILLQLTQLREH